MADKSKQHSILKSSGKMPTLLILAGVVLLVTVVFLLKNRNSQTAALAGASAEAQLDYYMKEGKPTLAFFHSNTCHSCKVMMETVDAVYPAYADAVAMVDVNVYDPENELLLQRAGIRSIPTLVFINRSGEGKVAVGVMEADLLREQLALLTEKP